MKDNIDIGRRRRLIVLSPEDTFTFGCHPGLSCFTRCCHNITIFLTPYDILRLKAALNISSSDFLSQYTVTMIGDSGLPVVILKMQGEAKSCPFVGNKGCCIYRDRPWACRIFPLQPESTQATEKAGKAFFSVMDVPYCLGLKETDSYQLADWIEEQGISPYLEMESLFKKVSASERLTKEKISNKKIQEMFYMASYDLDRFRRFVLESTFLERFEVEPQTVAQIKTDDLALVRLAVRWLEYGLLAQHVLQIKPGVLAEKKKEMGIE